MSHQSVSSESFHAFGELLKYLRRREHLIQLELSITVGYSEAQISRLEQNQRLPDVIAIGVNDIYSTTAGAGGNF